MASQNTDCYFYYYSTCKKVNCEFRHCPAALGTETTCPLWKLGRCFKSNCTLRHFDTSSVNRCSIPCYWETQPGGCRKPHCVFLHSKCKTNLTSAKDSSGLILPTFSEFVPSPSLNLPEDTSSKKSSPNASPRLECLSDASNEPIAASVQITPIVVNFDDESDSESVSSTPVKIPSNEMKSNNAGSAKSNLSSKFSDLSEIKDFGIKTLEQIKMEKIHKESEHFYKSAYDAPSLTPAEVTEMKHQEYYPPQSEFLSLPGETSMEKNLTLAIKEVTPQESEKESDLRKRLVTKRNFPSQKVPSEKRVVSFKKQIITKEGPSDSLNFKIKTLEEIRKEKESKLANKEDCIPNDNTVSYPLEQSKILSHSDEERPSKKIKLTRRPKELYEKALLRIKGKEDSPGSTDNIKVENRSQVVLHEVQSNKQTESNYSSTAKRSPAVVLGKRKAESEVEQKSKMLMKDSVEPINRMEVGDGKKSKFSNGISNGVKPEKDSKRGLRPFLRRPQLASSLLATIAAAKPSDSITTSEITSIPHSNGVKKMELSDPLQKDAKSATTSEETCISSTSPVEDEVILSTNMDGKNPVNRSLSADDFDNFLCGTDINMDEVEPDSAGTDSGVDILLEIEQFLDS